MTFMGEVGEAFLPTTDSQKGKGNEYFEDFSQIVRWKDHINFHPHQQYMVNLPLHCPFPESKAMLKPLCFLDTAQGLLRAGGSTIWGRINEERRGQKTVPPSS